MEDAKKKMDDEKRDKVLRRMLSTPPAKHVNKPLIKTDAEKKQGGTSGKK